MHVGYNASSMSAGWSLLPSSVFIVLALVNSDTSHWWTWASQRDPEVPHHSLTVQLPQDCCAFWLVPMCIVVEVTSKWTTWLPLCIFHIQCMTYIPDFPNCNNYGSLLANNPDPMLDDTPTNDNELHQVICNNFKIDYFQEMDVIIKLRNRLECKIKYTLPAFLPNKLNIIRQGLVTSGENIRKKRAIPALAIIQGVAAIGGMMIKGINALVDAKRASSFNNAIKIGK